MRTKAEIRSNVCSTTREVQLNVANGIVDNYINLTLQEIQDPAWAYEAIGIRGYNHLWTFNRRKNSFATVASTEFYQLPRDVDKLSIVRQTDSPTKLAYLPDDIFYKFVPDPTAEGNPLYYRLWEEEGVSTRLSADGTIDAVSSSASDTTQTISIVGYSTSGFVQSEVLTLTGTTKVTGSLTYDAGLPLRISKSASTTGNITITTGATSLLVIGAEERSPRFKIMGLYPIPSSAITMYVEYYTRIRNLVNEADVPDLDEKWLWIVRLGTLAKIYQYQKEENLYNLTQSQFANAVRGMVKADVQEPDYIPHLLPHNVANSGAFVISDNVATGFYGKGIGLTF